MKDKMYTVWAVLVCSFFIQSPVFSSNGEQPVTVTIGLVGNSILVNASINGTDGHFLIDTGSPGLILNDKYFKGIPKPNEKTDILDFQGNRNAATFLPVSNFMVSSMEMPRELALVTDLSKLEIIKGVAIHGVIGYRSLKRFELLFDFENKTLTLYPLGKKGQPVGRQMNQVPTSVLDIKMSGHLPFFITSINRKKMKIGIDSGSEINVMHQSFLSKNKVEMVNAKAIKASGLSGNLTVVQRGEISGLQVGTQYEENLQITTTNLSPLNQSLPVHVHGLLGIEYFRDKRFSINYQKKEMCVWSNDEEQLLSENTPPLELEAQNEK